MKNKRCPLLCCKGQKRGFEKKGVSLGREKEVDHAVHLSTRTMGDVTRDGSAALRLETSPTNLCQLKLGSKKGLEKGVLLGIEK
jgi:hypothetical protein